MSFSIESLANPLQTNKALYTKYSSSQTYYYSNVTAEITKEKRTSANINYEDIQYLCDSEEYFKRFYLHHQFPGKMFTFKEYYFYHEDCPRIFMKNIQQIYSKWQDRRRDLVYKKLKILYNQSFSSSRSSSKQQQNKSASGVTHFLLEISDYNPFSKKYYLRVQAKNKQEKQKQKNRSIKDLSSLNHQLSLMLNDISQLSNISTLQQQESPRLSSVYHSKKLKINYSSEYSTHNNSQSASNLQSTIKFNFKKNKNQSGQKSKSKILDQFHRKLQIKSGKSTKNQQKSNNFPAKASPKFADKDINEKFGKSKSIFQLSNFSSNKKSQIMLNLNGNKKQLFSNGKQKQLFPNGRQSRQPILGNKVTSANKKQNLKLKTQKKGHQNRISVQNKIMKRYDSQKKQIIRATQSIKKMTNDVPTAQQRGNYQSLGKKNSIHVLSNVQLKPLDRKVSLRQELPNFDGQKVNQFSDGKLQKNQQVRFRSHKSEYFSIPKKSLISRQNSPAKINFKISLEKKSANKQKFQIHLGKKTNQLKIQ